MRDQFALGSLLEERFAWSVVPMPATQDRKLFDVACDKFDQYQRQQRLDQHAYHDHPQSHRRSQQLFSDLPTSISHLPTIPDTMTSLPPAINLEDAHTGVPAQGPPPLARNNSRGSGRVLADRTSRILSTSHSHTSLVKGNLEDNEDTHPSQFLCRTMRVFVAWKA